MKTTPMKTTPMTLLALLALLTPAAWAQNIESHPGYADLGTFERALGGETEFDLDLDQQSLSAMAGLVDVEDDSLNALIADIESVRARSFKLDENDTEYAREGLSDVASELKNAGWNTLVSVRDESDQVEILFRGEGEHIQGLAALFVGGNNAGFANVVGQIDMAKVLAMASKLGSVQTFLKDMKDRGEQDG